MSYKRWTIMMGFVCLCWFGLFCVTFHLSSFPDSFYGPVYWLVWGKHCNSIIPCKRLFYSICLQYLFIYLFVYYSFIYLFICLFIYTYLFIYLLIIYLVFIFFIYLVFIFIFFIYLKVVHKFSFIYLLICLLILFMLKRVNKNVK